MLKTEQMALCKIAYVIGEELEEKGKCEKELDILQNLIISHEANNKKIGELLNKKITKKEMIKELKEVISC